MLSVSPSTLQQDVRRAYLVPALLLVLILGSCSRKSEQAPEMPVGAPTFPVKTGVAVSGDITEEMEVLGTVHSRLTTSVRSQIKTTVKQIHCQTGVPFSKGDLLITLDDNDILIERATSQAELKRAIANLALLEAGERSEVIEQLQAELKEAAARKSQSQTDLTRIERLFAENIGTEEEVDRARTNLVALEAVLARKEARLKEAQNGARPEELRVARAIVDVHQSRLNAAESELEKTRIFAAFDGVILEKVADIGSFTDVGDTLLEITGHRDLEAVMEIPEKLAGKLDVGEEISITADAIPAHVMTATVITVVPVADPQSHVMFVRADIVNPPDQLVAGMFLRGTVPIAKKKGAVLVPADALVYRKDDIFIFRVVETKVEMVPAIIGLTGDGVVEIVSGVRPDDVVVTTGGDVLFPDANVSIVDLGIDGGL